MTELYIKVQKSAEDIESILHAIGKKQQDAKNSQKSNEKIEKVGISSRRIEKISKIIPMNETPTDDVGEQIFDVLKSILE